LGGENKIFLKIPFLPTKTILSEKAFTLTEYRSKVTRKPEIIQERIEFTPVKSNLAQTKILVNSTHTGESVETPWY